jgi:hypothetical protein
MISYEQLVVTEYMRYNENFGSVAISQLEQPIKSLVDMHSQSNEAIVRQIDSLAKTVQGMQEAVNKPRIKTPVRDENGLITHVLEE